MHNETLHFEQKKCVLETQFSFLQRAWQLRISGQWFKPSYRSACNGRFSRERCWYFFGDFSAVVFSCDFFTGGIFTVDFFAGDFFLERFILFFDGESGLWSAGDSIFLFTSFKTDESIAFLFFLEIFKANINRISHLVRAINLLSALTQLLTDKSSCISSCLLLRKNILLFPNWKSPMRNPTAKRSLVWNCLGPAQR